MRLFAKPTDPDAMRFMEQYDRDNSSPGMKIFLYQYDGEKFKEGIIFFGKDAKFYMKPVIGTET